jgi:hypothetical protein
MVSSDICLDITQQLQKLLSEQKRLTVGDAEAQSVLEKILFEFSPCCRIVQALVSF